MVLGTTPQTCQNLPKAVGFALSRSPAAPAPCAKSSQTAAKPLEDVGLKLKALDWAKDHSCTSCHKDISGSLWQPLAAFPCLHGNGTLCCAWPQASDCPAGGATCDWRSWKGQGRGFRLSCRKVSQRGQSATARPCFCWHRCSKSSAQKAISTRRPCPFWLDPTCGRYRNKVIKLPRQACEQSFHVLGLPDAASGLPGIPEREC